MNNRLSHYLTALYPSEWQVRYRDEFEFFLESHPATPGTILDVLGWALRERIFSLWRMKMDRRQDSVVLMLYAMLAASAACINFYWSVDDTPLAVAMRSDWKLSTSWNLILAGSLLAMVVSAIASIPASVRVIKKAFHGKRWDVLRRFAVPFCAFLALILWLIAGMRVAGGHWIPTPWDVTGNWTPPANWPSLNIRWILSLVSFLLMAAGLILTAISLRQVVIRSDWADVKPRWFIISSVLLASSTALMTIGTLLWGYFAQNLAPSDFHARNGGIFGSTTFASWAMSLIVFITAALIAAGSARSATASRA